MTTLGAVGTDLTATRIIPADEFTRPTGFALASKELHEAFQKTRRLTIERRMEKFATSAFRKKHGLPLIWQPDLTNPDQFHATYCGMVSGRQSGVTCDGADFEKLAEYCYSSLLFPQHLVAAESQLGLGSGRERDIDLVFRFGTRTVFVNCKATTRERANIWQADLDNLYQNLGSADWYLLCLFAEKDIGCSVESSLNEQARMRRYIADRVATKEALDHLLIVCAQDISGHEQVLRRIAP
jgi:hypothetical protein